jgi:hypothetical protein
MQLTGLSYDDWLEHAFGREVRTYGNPWFFDPDSDWWTPSSAEYVAYLTRLFENPEPLVDQFADSQIAQGLTYLVDVSATGDDGHLADSAVPLGDRIRLVRATVVLFRRLFALRSASASAISTNPVPAHSTAGATCGGTRFRRSAWPATLA